MLLAHDIFHIPNLNGIRRRRVIMTVENFLMLLSGIAWSIVYIDAIRVGIKDRSYAMPIWALALNIAWEFLHAFLGYRAIGLSLQIAINWVWFLLDLGLLYTFFKFGRRYFPHTMRPAWFYIWGCSVLAAAFVIQYSFINEFGLLMGAVYAAFLQNLLMSVLFIAMFVQRRSTEGQTLLIAVSKWIGTAAPTVLMGVLGIQDVLEPNLLVLTTGSLIFIIDFVYVVILYHAKKAERQHAGLAE